MQLIITRGLKLRTNRPPMEVSDIARFPMEDIARTVLYKEAQYNLRVILAVNGQIRGTSEGHTARRGIAPFLSLPSQRL